MHAILNVDLYVVYLCKQPHFSCSMYLLFHSSFYAKGWLQFRGRETCEAGLSIGSHILKKWTLCYACARKTMNNYLKRVRLFDISNFMNG